VNNKDQKKKCYNKYLISNQQFIVYAKDNKHKTTVSLSQIRFTRKPHPINLCTQIYGISAIHLI